MSANIDEDRVLEALEEALEARLIEALPRGLERYQFSHALIQQALSEELSPSRRVRLHARIGDALEELYGQTRRLMRLSWRITLPKRRRSPATALAEEE